MNAASIEMIGGQSPWEIVRAYPYVTVTSLDGDRFEVACRTPDDSGWPFVHAIEALTTEEQQRYADDVTAGRPPAGPEDMCAARALMRLIDLVEDATGALPPALSMFYNGAHVRGRHPSAQTERLRSRRPRRGR